MKNIFILFLFACCNLWGQNGMTGYPMPTNYNIIQTQNKNAITTDNAGNTWVGFRDIGLGKFDGANWTMFNTGNTIITTNNISALNTQYGNVIWVGIQTSISNGGLYSYNGTTWTDFSTSINSNFVNVFFADNTTSNLWVGTKAGVYKFDGSIWTNFTVANSGLASDTVLSLAIDPSGNLLAGTQRGLSVENGVSWTNYSTSTINFPSNIITALYSDAQNGTWVGTSAGVGKFALPYFLPLDTIAPTSAIIYPTTACFSITKGPHGGVIFNGKNSSLIEVVFDRPKIYYYPLLISNGTFLCFNSANGKTWMVNRFATSLNNFLFGFDGINYVGLGISPYNTRYLDVNNVRTAILNRGDNNWNTINSGVYYVPKNGDAGTIFSSALWIGGLDAGGGLHEAAMTYRQAGMDFFPGPLDTTNGSTDSITASQYDYVWKIEKLKILEFQYYWSIGAVQNGTYQVDHDILTWPAQGTGNFTRNMAPFVDVNGNGIYDPLTGGDYPDIKGDQELYCIYNDNLAVHSESGGVPLKVEVHAAAYAYFCLSVADSQKVINNTTFYDYQIFNRSNSNYNSVFLGMFQDGDLGDFADDYVGCYSPDNFSFIYNGDPNDGCCSLPTQGTYGAHPPIQSLAVLDGPLADAGDGMDNNNNGMIDEVGEKDLMTGFLFYYNDFTGIGNPEDADDYYLFTSWRWKDSTYLTYGGNGYLGTTPTHFEFDGMPYDTSAWTEISTGNTPYDRRGLTSCGPFTLNSGQSVHLNYADVFSRDTTIGPPDTAYYDQAANDVRRVRNWYNNNNAPSCVQWGVGIQPQTSEIHFSLYPNPTSSLLTIEYKPQSKDALYEIFDLTGQLVESGKLNATGQTILSVENFSSGIYLVRVIDKNSFSTMKFIKE
jgi:hypothetical protein